MFAAIGILWTLVGLVGFENHSKKDQGHSGRPRRRNKDSNQRIEEMQVEKLSEDGGGSN